MTGGGDLLPDVDDLPLVGSLVPVERTREPCVSCGQAIAPGAAYVARGARNQAGPRHLGCPPVCEQSHTATLDAAP